MTAPTGQPVGPTYNCRRCGHTLGTHAVVGNAAVLHAGGLLLRNRSEVLCECCLHRTVWRPPAGADLPKNLDNSEPLVQATE